MNALRERSRSITVRRQHFNFDEVKPYFFDDNPLLSYLLIALSMTFPVGERFFVHSVRQVRDRVSDPELQKDISAFIGQEAMHSLAHEDFNRFAERLGVDVPAFERFDHKRIEDVKAQASPRVQLAITCALEHFTAIIAQFVLQNPKYLKGLDAEAGRLFYWHCLEELEHKSVAFDTYQAIYHDDKTRKRIMRILTATFLGRISYVTGKLVISDPKSRFRVGKHLDAAYRLSQMFRILAPLYISYYRHGFHPNDHDTEATSRKWMDRLQLAAA